MSADSSKPIERDQVIRDTRERVARVEIETHRIKSNLARLEAANEAAWAEELSGGLTHDGAPVAAALVVDSSNDRDDPAASSKNGRAAVTPTNRSAPVPLPQVRVAQNDSKRVTAPRVRAAVPRESRDRKQNRKRRMAPAWGLSLGMHALVLAVIAPLGYVVATNDNIPLFASMFDFEESQFDPGVVPVELIATEDDFNIEEAVYEEAAAPAAEDVGEFLPIEESSAIAPAETAGLLNALPTDVGTLMAGGGEGEASGGRRRSRERDDLAGEMGRTSFFGTPARANRVVFLVDNSGSMKQGRMETTLLELARSIDAMSEKQEFYIVFYSDQAYPMLYPNSVMEPLAATKENKQRVYDWLYTIELCRGGAVLKAMEIAKSLEPHVVYMLSDGNMSGDVTMQRLTQPGEYEFAVHTLGMGVEKPRDAQNLAAIAQAHRGTFQLVRTLPAAVQSAKQRPIRSNGQSESWGEHLLP